MLLFSNSDAAGVSYLTSSAPTFSIALCMPAMSVPNASVPAPLPLTKRMTKTRAKRIKMNQEILLLFDALCSFRSFAAHLQWVSAQRQWLSIQLLQSPDCLAAWAQYQWRQLPNACPGLEAGLLIYPSSCGRTDGCLAPLNLL